MTDFMQKVEEPMGFKQVRPKPSDPGFHSIFFLYLVHFPHAASDEKLMQPTTIFGNLSSYCMIAKSKG